MNLLRSCCLAVLPQLDFSFFSLKCGKEHRPSGFMRLAAVLALLCLGSAGAWAATCTVNNANNSGAGSLRACILSAGSGDTIQITATSTITLASALPDITHNLTITGPGANKLTIDGGGSYQIFNITAGTVSISGLKLSSGISAGSGAAISQTAGSLTVTGCEFANNTSSVEGGAIYAGGSLTVSSSTFTGNSSQSGGAIRATAGLTLTNSTFSGNSATNTVGLGGAVYATGTTAITNNTFSGNTVGSSGAGAAIDHISGTATIANNIFDGNSPLAAIFNNATANASYNVFYNNGGGDCPSCTTNTNSVDASSNPLVLPLTYYGGTTKTFLPQPSSQALCAGSALSASGAGLTLDQRGFAMNPAYSTCAGAVDAGAVQANYVQVQAGGDAGAGSGDCPGASCTLRDAITLANGNGYGDIDFASGLSNINLGGSSLSLSGTTGINIIGGFGSGAVTVNGGGPTSNFSVFTVPSSAQALIYGLTIANGNILTSGGGILNSGTLQVVNSTISGNSAVFAGGGIYNNGTFAIAESTIANNSVTNTTTNSIGGGIYSSNALQVVNTTIAGNSASGHTADDGGGIYVDGGTATLANTIVSANTTAHVANANISGAFTGNGNVIGAATNATNNKVGGAGAQILPLNGLPSYFLPGSNAPVLQLNGIGATLQTIIPSPDSPAICAGLTANIIPGLTTDERGYPLIPTGGYCVTGTVDAGAVQTNYTSASIVQQPSTSVPVNTNMASPEIIQVLETDTLLSPPNNTDGVNGISLSLALSTDNAHLVNGSAITAGAGATAGEATFTSLQVSAPEQNDTLVLGFITLGSITLGPWASSSFNVIGPAAHLAVTAPATATVGAPFSMTVTAQDTVNNTAPSYTGTVHFTSSDLGAAGGLVLPPDYTFVPADNGVHTFVNGVTLVTAGSQTVTATDTVTPAITGFVPVSVGQATPTIAITGNGTSNVNQSVTFTATVTPPNGTVALSGSVTFTITDKNSSIVSICTSAAPVTWNSGPGNATATCTTAALTAGLSPFTIGATYNGDSNYNTKTATSVSQAVTPITPTVLITGNGTTNVNAPATFTATLSGVSFTPTDATGTVGFTSNGNPIAGCTAMIVTAQVATCTTSALIGGSDTIGATYNGDLNFATASAPTVTQTVTALTPTVTITGNGTTNVDQAVNLTATLSGVSFTPHPATGTIKFTVGGVTISSCAAQPVAAQVATCNTTSSLLVAGADSIGAVYTSGDTNFTTATASPVTQTVNALNPTISLTPSANPVNVGTSVTFTAQLSGTLSPVIPAGTVTFAINGVANADCPAVTVTAGGSATCTTSSLLVPADTITATYSGDTSYVVAAAATTTETVNKVSALTALATTLANPAVNQTVTLTATVTAPTGVEVKPTGSVTFTEGATVLCAAAGINPANQQATCSYAFTSVTAGGTVTATYGSDQNFNAGTVATTLETVSASSTTTTLTSTPNPSTVNQPVAFTATVTPTYTAGVPAAQPTGTVTFTNTTNSTTLCTVTLSGGVVPVCSYTFITNGSYSVVATYTTGDLNFTGSVSSTTNQVVNAATTTVVLTSPTNPSVVNQSVTLTATIDAFGGTATVPTGTMTYTDTSTSTILCTNTLSGGNVPACNYAFLTQGTHTVTAAYSGDPNFKSATSNILSQVVNAASTTTSLVSSPNPSSVNQSVAFTATVTPAFTAGATKPTGTVVFTNTTTSTQLCSVALSGGVVPVCNYTFTSQGSNHVVATYTTGDTNFSGSASGSNADIQVVSTTPTTTTVSGNPSPSTVNGSVIYTATVTPSVTGTTNPTGSVTFTYAGIGALVGTNGPLCTSVSVSAATPAIATCTSSSLAQAGTYTITAVYTTGDANFASSTGTTSQSVLKNTTAPGVSVTSPGATTVNVSVNLTATVTFSSGATVPTGTVTLIDQTAGTTVCSNVTIAPATSTTTTATCSYTPLTSGNHTIVANYSGDTNYPASTSLGYTQAVSPSTTSLAVTSSLNPEVTPNAVTFTATITPAHPGAAMPTGTVAFTSTDGTVTVACTADAVGTPVLNPSTTRIATCTAAFPTTLYISGQTITATYNGSGSDTNFTSSVGTLAGGEVVQNFFIANKVVVTPLTTTGPGTPVTSTSGTLNTTTGVIALAPVSLTLTQGYHTGSSFTLNNGTDPFFPATVETLVTSTGGFPDTLNLGCVVTNTSGTVRDPSCTVAATMSGATGTTLVYTLTASSSAPIGTYTVTLTGIDSTSLNDVHSEALTLYVVGQASTMTLAQGAGESETATFMSATGFTGTTTAPITYACGTVWNLTTLAVVPSSQYTGMVCEGSGWTPVSSTPTATATVKIALSAQTAQLETSSSVSLAALLGIPLFALAGWVKGRKSSRRNFFRFLGLIVALVAGISYVTGCGGSFTAPQQLSSSGLGTGSYLVQVIATDAATPAHQYYTVVPLSVSTNH